MSDTPIYDELNNEPHDDLNHTTPVDKAPQTKVTAATIGAGVGSAIATVTVWVVNVATGLEVPEGVELALGVIVSAGLAFVGGYWKRG